jgi:hypothetical protein
VSACQHSPGTVVELVPGEEQWSTCVPCGTPIARLFHDYDGDGHWGWSRWGLAPVPVDAAAHVLPPATRQAA